MGAGLYMQPMMLPPGMQPIHGAHMPHFSPMGLGMGMGMGFGMNMLNMNNGPKMLPFQGPHYPVPGTGFQGMPGSNLPAFPHPGQVLPMSMQQAPIIPAPISGSFLNMPIGLPASGVAGPSSAPQLAPPGSKKDANPHGLSSMASNNVKSSLNPATIQVVGFCAYFWMYLYYDVNFSSIIDYPSTDISYVFFWSLLTHT